MKYLEFIIQKYKAINKPLIVSLRNNRLVPIIGINECGKTTILHGIFSFDYFNDNFNETIRHLNDVKNLYKPGQNEHAKITAKIQISKSEFSTILKSLPQDEIKGRKSYLRLIDHIDDELIITRDLVEKTYTIESKFFKNCELNNLISKEIIRNLPYILFFDDFRDSFPDQIEIDLSQKSMPQGWLAILEKLFEKTNENFSIFSLTDIEERERNTIISQVQKKLNETLTREWQKFNLSDNESLKINISFTPKSTNLMGPTQNASIKFDILETDRSGLDHYFYIRDRSKGFYWFFNFVMKLEFNPKVLSKEGIDAIYLLDEPGSYLHAAAQSKLCKKLRDLSLNNNVVYCTHSHYLLNPEIIPISSIKIAEKKKDFNVELNSIYDYKTQEIKRSAFQPLYDALQIKPFSLDIKGKVLIVEGIYDYFCLKLFTETDYQILPSLNADSIVYYISLMIGWNIEFNALWDNDPEGVKAYKKAIEKFGVGYIDRFKLLPLGNKHSKSILQNFIDGNEFKLIKTSLGIPKNSNFNKVISTLFYSNEKELIISKLDKTRKNFAEIVNSFSFSNSKFN